MVKTVEMCTFQPQTEIFVVGYDGEGKPLVHETTQKGLAVVKEDGRVVEYDRYFEGHDPKIPQGPYIVEVVFTQSGIDGSPETLVREVPGT